MKPGDMIQFRRELYERIHPSDCGIWDWAMGLLVSVCKVSDQVTILCEGKVYQVPTGDARVPWIKGFKDEDWK